jgi:hypothetical protein
VSRAGIWIAEKIEDAPFEAFMHEMTGRKRKRSSTGCMIAVTFDTGALVVMDRRKARGMMLQPRTQRRNSCIRPTLGRSTQRALKKPNRGNRELRFPGKLAGSNSRRKGKPIR